MGDVELDVRNDRRAGILDRAAELFAAKGIAATSMADIANAVGIQKASLYHFFASKEELLARVLRPVVERPHDDLAAILKSEMGVERELVEAMAALGREYEREPDRMQILVRERLHLHLSAPNYAEILTLKTAYTRLWQGLLQRGVDSGIFKPSLNRTTAFAIIGSMNWMHAWFTTEGTKSGEQIGREFARLFLYGMRETSQLSDKIGQG